MHFAAWYRGTPDQSSTNSGNKWPLATPLTLPNFVTLGRNVPINGWVASKISNHSCRESGQSSQCSRVRGASAHSGQLGSTELSVKCLYAWRWVLWPDLGWTVKWHFFWRRQPRAESFVHYNHSINRVKWRHISMVAIRSPFCRSRPSYCA